MKKPIIVTLCGSTKFKQAFIDANFRETMAGKIVLSVGFLAMRTRLILPKKTRRFLMSCTNEKSTYLMRFSF